MSTMCCQKCFLFTVCSVDNEIFSVWPVTGYRRAG